MAQKATLSKEEIERFSRQLLLSPIRTEGQVKLRNASVLIVGMGGLGSPAALYLAAAGIGRLGLLDYDNVEASNLQRQIVHCEDSVGEDKALSAANAVRKLSSLVAVEPLSLVLDASNAIEVLERFDVILDASDNVATRYLLSDACILLGKPLVSGSALRMEGQLTVYNHNGGPCYRCIFPTPPPPETVTNCSDGGVLGVGEEKSMHFNANLTIQQKVTGIIGCFQALEAIKIITGMEASYSQKLMLFDAVSGSMRVVKLRGRRPDCAICGNEPTITDLIDYVQFCGANATDKAITRYLLTESERISPRAYHDIQTSGTPHVLLDVRDKMQYDIAYLPGSINVPWSALPRRLGEVLDLIGKREEGGEKREEEVLPVYVLCRLGNDSQLAVKLLQASGVDRVWDVEGGLHEWAETVDSGFPKY
ncbi:hypothetical protein BC830DRAFT_1165973 [Chytriomyces sp. MP71]|nr:hypothetical protein BC830DRAFT_1165973 [Chytriomyces sp. MP71]